MTTPIRPSAADALAQLRRKPAAEALAELRAGATPDFSDVSGGGSGPAAPRVPTNAYSDFLGGRSDLGDPETFARGAADAATLGWGDEAVNAIRASARSFGHPWTLIPEYNRLQQETEARSDSLRRENPGSALAGNLAGMVATAGPLSKLLPAVEGGLLKRTAAGALTGAGVGAVAGAGMAGQGRRGEGAALGGASGAVLGGLAPAAADATGAVARRLLSRAPRGATPMAPETDQPLRSAIGTALAPRDPNLPAPVEVGTLPVKARSAGAPFASGSGQPPVPPSVARSTMREPPTEKVGALLLRTMRRDRTTPKDALDGLISMTRLTGDPETIAEVSGPNMRGLVRTAEGLPGEGRSILRESIGGRQARAPHELTADMESVMGRATENTTDFVEQLVKARSTEARSLYDEAYRALPVVRDPKVIRAFNDIYDAFPEVAKDAGHRANRLAIADGRGDIQTNSTEWLNYFKQGLDNAIQARQGAADAGQKLAGNEARILRNKKNALLDALKVANPKYAKALRIFAGESEVIDNIPEGQAFLKKHPDVIRSELGRLSTAGKQAYQIGAMRAMADQLERTPPTGSVAKVARTGFNRDQIRAVFGDGPQADALLHVIGRRGGIAETNAMIQGSRTAPMAAEVADLAGGGFMDAAQQVAVKGPKRAAIDAILRSVTKFRLGNSEAEFSNLATQLSKQGIERDDLLRYLIELQAKQGRAAAGAAGRARTAATAAGTTAGATGRRP